ncbi:hypothetical protein BDZ94DRAFT_1312825 [Collybia nuda]|uniref:DUF6533 domain-containing protein n=1 Tax=Collybia nuda TaxID=64659 RepID=A0A9P6CE87_9AGAR|nr:hypothetical protein BDZ94DRAFT_1312825 [Collybia nuda]
MTSTAAPGPEQLVSAVTHLNAGKYFQVAAYVILIYDHALTFSDEVERIWKQKISGAAVLFLINRYLTPLQFMIVINAFHDPIWTPSVGVSSVIYDLPGASTVALIAVCELIMILRVYALYGRSGPILGFLMILWIIQITLSSISLTHGFPVSLPPGLVGCILTGEGPLFPAIWIMPLVTDFSVFLLMLWKSRDYIRQTRSTRTINVFLRDGSLYFLVICMANLLNTLLFVMAESDLKVIGASFSQLITATMISRLVINLRSADADSLGQETNLNQTTRMGFMTRTIGNLGEELDTIFQSSIGYSSTFTEELSIVKTHPQSIDATNPS